MRSKATIGAVVSAAPAVPPSPPATQSGSTSPSGSWTIVPGLLVINWNYDAAKGEVDVSTNFLWWTIDTLTGTLSKAQLNLKDTISLLGDVEGSIGIAVVFTTVAGGDAPGLWISGDLEVFGKDWNFKDHILSW